MDCNGSPPAGRACPTGTFIRDALVGAPGSWMAGTEGGGGPSHWWQRVRRDDLVRHGLSLAVLVTITNALGYLYRVITGRLLGPEDYGTFAFFVALIAVLEQPLAAISTNVTHQMSFYSAAAPGGVRRLLHTVLGGATGFTAAGAVIVGVALLAIRPEFRHEPELAVIVALTLGLGGPYSVFLGIVNGARRYQALGLINVAGSAVRIVLGAALVWLGMGVAGALWGSAARVLMMFALAVALAPWPRSGPGRAMTGAAFARYTVPIAVVLFAFTAMSNIDLLVAQAFLPGHEAGLYAGAAGLARLALFLPVGVGFVLVPMASERAGRAQTALHLLARGLRVTAGLSGAVVVGFVVAGPLAIRILLGPQFEGGAFLLPVLAFAMGLQALSGLFVRYFLAIRRPMAALVPASAAALQAALLLAFHASPTQVAADMVAGSVASVVLAFVVSGRVHAVPGPAAPAAP